MATTKTTTKKTSTASAVVEENSSAELQKENEQLRDMIANMTSQMASMQQMFASMTAEKSSKNKGNDRTVKVYSLITNTYVLSTGEGGRGITFVFDNFGDSKDISIKNLHLIKQWYGYQLEEGWVYIDDTEAVEELGLSEFYDANVLDVKKFKDLANLDNHDKVDFIITNLSKMMKEKVGYLIAEKLEDGEKFDLNYLSELQEAGIDIQKLRKDIAFLRATLNQE